MDDPELQAIRAARMAELRNSQGGASGSNQGNEQQQKQDDMRNSMLAAILAPSARERLSRIRMVRNERAKAVEEYLLRLAQSGQLQRKVEEDELVEILDQLSKQERKETKIVFERRQLEDDDEDDDFFD